ncbi:hypothetical protein PFAG_02627 [Plasmodium falciparum Santa Lucia]|uniref:Plasmodium RESA N-terminal domain-containing protein n=13 Tax=Plasmodium falciparum TaxID=5833 RepID=Q8I2G3_PLAF7|nr:Plasmodium exported protein, unknown function [Plasmodium falciparum 3D7]ETW18773.1 hypothetical protein PFFVO_02668 [Plasmodium falciparum Vietnam Oak-Knoll (FVO)]ETW36630.1 hypothetical protein PFTANZ_02700 [Plasmodium falciparum Tanzania (2000708)]ETW42903.1 hypothetical protein PFNF135_02797 [Plasmodium falciparum NF135/5.C10]ETW49340.1 hypothetical protein PFMALIP_02659 [Plasmodium falciparum MaliPS096_E11]ETW56848.1 hypothetical protein PFUGPA_01180 [Plasmodium falciparum Palo Alto/Ug|eukprot:XP_001352221.1 Plasmodium exported protein, unknown function [Plasmodium falciparum 3D7]
MRLNKDMKKMQKLSANCIFFKIFTIVIFCILQCASHIENDKLPYLQGEINMGNKLTARRLASLYISEQRYKKIEMNSSSDLEKKWKNICFEWRRDLNDICKQIFWEFKKVCIKNKVNVDIENDTWKTWRDEVQDRIKMKEEEDYQDYLRFKETQYTTTDMNKFIYEKIVSFKLFNDELLSEKDSFIECLVNKWLKYKEEHFDIKSVK